MDMQRRSFTLISITRNTLRGLLWLFLFILLAARPLQAQSNMPSSKPVYGGTLVWGTTNPPTIINPILTNQGVSAALVELLFDPLLRINGRGELTPCLAQTWDISPDRKRIVFHLRHDIRFHDGAPLTAEDVRFTYESIMNPANRSPLRLPPGSEGTWQVLDPFTIEFLPTTFDDSLLYRLNKPIAPAHLLKHAPKLSDTPFNFRPVGSGPFMLSHWDQETNEITLVANPNYSGGRAYLDKIIVRVFPDSTSLWSALMRQEIDLVRFLNRDDYQILKSDSAFKTYEVRSTATCVIVYDLTDPILSDPDVRRAIAKGIDVPRMLAVLGYSGLPSSGPFQLNSPEIPPPDYLLSYDPANARLLLAKAGWRDRDHNGVLEKGSRELAITMLIDDRADYFHRIAMTLRQQLSEIGIKLIVQGYKDTTAITPEFLNKNKPQAWLRFFESGQYAFSDILDRWYPSRSSQQQLWHYQNSAIDRIIAAGSLTGSGNQSRQTAQSVQQLIYADQPACFLFSPTSLHAVSARIADTDELFTPTMPDHSIRHWHYIK